MKNSRTAAAIGTAIAAVLILLILLTGRLTLSASQWPPLPKNETELIEIEEEFVDLFEPVPVRANPAPAYTPEKVINESTPGTGRGHSTYAMPEKKPRRLPKRYKSVRRPSKKPKRKHPKRPGRKKMPRRPSRQAGV